MNKQGLVDLLTRIGDDKIELQNLDQCLMGASSRKRGFTELRFLTQSTTPGEVMTGDGRIGLVLWLDRSDVQAARDAFAATQEPQA